MIGLLPIILGFIAYIFFIVHFAINNKIFHTGIKNYIEKKEREHQSNFDPKDNPVDITMKNYIEKVNIAMENYIEKKEREHQSNFDPKDNPVDIVIKNYIEKKEREHQSNFDPKNPINTQLINEAKKLNKSLQNILKRKREHQNNFDLEGHTVEPIVQTEVNPTKNK